MHNCILKELEYFSLFNIKMLYLWYFKLTSPDEAFNNKSLHRALVNSSFKIRNLFSQDPFRYFCGTENIKKRKSLEGILLISSTASENMLWQLLDNNKRLFLAAPSNFSLYMV